MAFASNRRQIRRPATHAMLFLKNRRVMDTAVVGTGARASAAAARERSMRDPPTPVAATSSIKDNRNLGPLAPLHAPLFLLLLPLRVADPLFHVVRVDLEVLLLVEALHDLLRA